MKRTLSLEWRREDHAGRGAAVGEQLFDEVFELGHGGEDDFEHEGVVAGEVVALLHGVEGGKEFQEWLVACAFAGEAYEGGDGETEGLQVDVSMIALDDLKAFQAAQTLGGGGGGEADAPAKLGYSETRVVGEFAENLAVDLINSGVKKHWALPGAFGREVQAGGLMGFCRGLWFG